MIIPVNYAQVNYRFTGLAAPTGAEVTLGLADELYAGTLADLAQDLMDAWATTIHTNLSSQLILSEVLVKRGPNDTGPQVTVSGSVGGGVTSVPEVPNTSILVSKNTAFGGRTGRGRMFVPGVPEAFFDGSGDMGATTVANLQTEMDDFYAALTALDVVPALLHGAGSPVTEPRPILGFTVSAKAATQRRRLRR